MPAHPMHPSPRFDRRRLLQGGLAAGAGLAGVAALGSGMGAGASTRPYRALTSGGTAHSGAKGLGPGGSLLAPGSLPYPHLAAGTDTLPEIEHIVVLMMENHSFDDHLGMLGRGDGLTVGPKGKPVNYNPNPAGGYVQSFHNPNTVGYAKADISQSWDASHICWDHGTNMGFVKGCSPAAMGYWTGEDLPFYYSMAKQFPIGDRYFCSVMGQTYPNRRFLIAASAYGDVSTNISGVSQKDAPNGTIFDRLDTYGISWRDYYPDLPTTALFLPEFLDHKANCQKLEVFFADAAAGNLPAFSLIDPYDNDSEEGGDISIGEAYAARVIGALMDSPNWAKTVIIWTYDEHGGWYDHVPPAPAVRPDNVPPEITVPPDQPGSYDYTGFRVPVAVISPFSKPNFVSHVVHDHTSILKLVETKWNLPALTYRDANAHNMLEFLDFSTKHGAFAEPPKLAKPLNPFVGPLPDTSQSQAAFHPVATAIPGPGPAPGAQIAKPAKNADKLIAAHTKRAISTTAE